ncbi:MAG: Hpt domain-containing protein, partial [Gammaproteobacteria bacterium]|nr:Hpt domain-containing protein [Gammaproteobacteria bacterium]
MTATKDFVALDWIRGEVGQTLEKAQQSLMAVAESPEDTDKMRACLTFVHQIHSTLRMLELSGPVQIASEMENLAQALTDNNVSDLNGAQEALMQSILQLPRYLDRIQKEQKELPQASLSIVNNLRVARGEQKLAPEAAGAWEYELSIFSQPLSAVARDTFESQKGAENLPKLRQKYQGALMSLVKKESPKDNLMLLGKIFNMASKICADSPIGHLLNLYMALVEGVGTGAIKLDNNVGHLLKQLDGPFKVVSAGGVESLATAMPEPLVQDLLDRICDAPKASARMQTVKDRYLVSSEVSVEEIDDFAIMGPDDDTIGTVIKILLDELKGVTDKLDLYVRASDKTKQDLVDMMPMMSQISGTLSMVGMQEYQELVDAQIDRLKEIQSSSGEPSEEQLMQMAQAFIELESRMDRLTGGREEGESSDKLGDLNEAHASVARETRVGLNQCTDAVMEFVSSGFDTQKIQSLPAILLSLRGGMTLMEQRRAGDVLLACARYIEKVLLTDQHKPDEEEIDSLADAITSIDYFLERLLENSNEPYKHMLEVAEESVEKLGFEVSEVLEREADREVQQKVSSYQPQMPDAVRESDQLSPEAVAGEELSSELAEPSTVSATEEFDVASLPDDEDDMIDDEIIEIFIEESAEVLDTISEFFPVWKTNPADQESLTEIRRAFHTLKGSGRMVGATVVGELSWSIEDMLNRVLNKSIGCSDGIVALVEETVSRIPAGI